MGILSPDQRQQIEKEGVIRIENGAFVILRSDLYERVRPLIEGHGPTIVEQSHLLSEAQARASVGTIPR